MQADVLATLSRSSPPCTSSALLLAATLLLGPAAQAQGLGELALESALNEPLRASIELLDTGGLEPGQLQIGIASIEEHEAAGITRSALASGLAFELEPSTAGPARVRISSQERVTEPFLTLLVSARWPGGGVLREYTVLLDLPGVAAADFVQTHSVGPGESLQQIAEQFRPGPDISVPQMMVAIQRANEEAFINNDIGRILTGRVLRIPPRAEIALVEPAAALTQVNSQYRRAGLQPIDADGAAAARAATDELSILGQDDASTAGIGAGDYTATIAALEAELMLSEEELDRATLEHEKLSARLTALEEQIALLENIIAIEDQRMAQLQDGLAANAQAGAATAAGRSGGAPQSWVQRGVALLQDNLLPVGAALALLLGLVAILVARARAREDWEPGEFELADESATAAPVPDVAPGDFDPLSLHFDESDAAAADEASLSLHELADGEGDLDSRLDLAVAYQAMGDVAGAIDILDEVIAVGDPLQVEEARHLKAKWQDA